MRILRLAGMTAVCASILVSCGQKNNDSLPITEAEKQSTTTSSAEMTNVSVNPEATTPAQSEIPQDSIAKQLQIIADNKEMWLTNEKLDDFTPYRYTVADLNQNGKLEMIESTCQGTGIYTTTHIYEVEEKTASLIDYESLLSEFDSEADLVVDMADVYYDRENNIYHYIFFDLIKNGAAEYYENTRDWFLKDAQIIENFLAYRTTLYSSDGNATVTCEQVNEDGTNKEITEDEYNNIAATVFTNMEKKTVYMHWESKTPEEGKQMSDSEILDMLKRSWDGFGLE